MNTNTTIRTAATDTTETLAASTPALAKREKINGKILAVRGGYDVVVSRGTAESRYGTYRTVAAAVEGARELGYVVLRTAGNGEIYLTRDPA